MSICDEIVHYYNSDFGNTRNIRGETDRHTGANNLLNFSTHDTIIIAQVAAVAKTPDGSLKLVHVWSSILEGGDDHLSYQQLENELHIVKLKNNQLKQQNDELKLQQQGGKKSVSALDWVLVVILLALVVGIIFYNFRKVNNMPNAATANSFERSYRDNFNNGNDNGNDSNGGIEMEIGQPKRAGLDMRQMDGVIAVKKDDEDDRYDSVQL